MDAKVFLNAIDTIVEEKQIDKEVIIDAMEQALLSAYKRNFKDTNARVVIDQELGTINIYSQREVVEEEGEYFDDFNQILLSTAKDINPNYEVGDIIEEEVTPDDFGRVAAQTAKQVAVQKIREAERKSIFEEFALLEGEMITGTLSREDNNNFYVDLGRSHAVLSKKDIVPGEVLKMGSKVDVYLSKVEHNSKFPLLVATRISNQVLTKIMEKEIPEIKEGLVEIYGVVRDAGDRSKVAVFGVDENVDAIGSCIGPKGTRIQNVINGLSGEKLDVVLYDKDPAQFIQNALSPAKVITVVIEDLKEKKSIVIVTDDQLSLAIGKKGQNARLAAKLTGWKIDIKSLAQAQEEGIF